MTRRIHTLVSAAVIAGILSLLPFVAAMAGDGAGPFPR
jgi:hypothetical protein